MSNIASYKSATELITDKPINLIYGLNGTGKTTFSKFLYNSLNDLYKACSINADGEFNILVYNKDYIKDTFYEDSFKGIFTLSKENKQAKEKIDTLSLEIEKNAKEKAERMQNNNKIIDDINNLNLNYQNIIWNIKKEYDNKNYMNYCFNGIKRDKNTFFNFFLSIVDNGTKKNDVSIIENSIKELNDNNELISNIQHFENDLEYIEKDNLFKKAIIGNNNSYLSEIIEKLNSSDWVKKGIDYIDLNSNETQKCPFCQKDTIDIKMIDELKKLFDDTYDKNIKIIHEYYSKYELLYNSFPTLNFDMIPMDAANMIDLSKKINNYKETLLNNLNKIKEKINMPSLIISLDQTDDMLSKINNQIDNINLRINDLNNKINNKTTALQKNKKDFWSILKRNNSAIISKYLAKKKELEDALEKNKKFIDEIEGKIRESQNLIIEEQKKTINIDEAISNINSMLTEIGITDFYITKASDKMYKIVRDRKDNNVFNSLSEGEKMIVSFLYFIESCKGLTDPTSDIKDKIIVIDDPINSMSHIYIFNISRLIKNVFFDTRSFKQIFILTHSLYFFYELVYMDKEKRNEYQKLFRIVKNLEGSYFENLGYSDIQNDYQAYWNVIKDRKQHPALIANSMRNIIEYFFGFVEKQELNNVFQKNELKQNRFEAFNRYINRESHSISQNIFDIKEFNYDDFYEAFKLVFTLSHYEKHYLKMIK